MPTPLTLSLVVNQQPTTVTVQDNTEPLLYVLRNQVDTPSVKYGCGVAQCGACTVVVNGVTTRSCVTPLSSVAPGAQITTLDGDGDGKVLAALKAAFVQNQAAQCGYCIPGIIMGSYNWLLGRRAAGNKAMPSDTEVTNFLSGIGQTPAFVYLCRCGTHMRIVRAIQTAAYWVR